MGSAGARHTTGGRVRVLQWAQEHGDVGGVTTSVHGLTAVLRGDGYDVRYVDTGSLPRALRALPWLWRRRALHVLHITRLWRAVVLAPILAVVPGRTALALHSGSVSGQAEALGGARGRLTWLALRAFDEIWAVNAEIRRALPAPLRRRTSVVTPFVEGLVASSRSRERHLVSVATNGGLPHYNADLAVSAVARVRRDWPDARLWILAYGADGPALAALRESVAGLDWVRVSFDLPPGKVSEALARSEVFLRPTSWDGDSMVVREALALGVRVVASPASPRPAGVELAALDAERTADVVVHGGPVSDGAGLASESVADAARRALALVVG